MHDGEAELHFSCKQSWVLLTFVTYGKEEKVSRKPFSRGIPVPSVPQLQ